MAFAYGDIVDLQRPVHGGDVFSRRHPPMARLNRAKLFAPFAALSGFSDAIRQSEICYLPRRRLSADEARRLNRLLNALCLAAAARRPAMASVVYFVPGPGEGRERPGRYFSETGPVRGVDPVRRALRVGERAIPLADICAVTDPTGQRFLPLIQSTSPQGGVDYV